MIKVGDQIDGYCQRCRLNTYQNVAATDGRTVFTVTCRTCRNTMNWKPEVSAEEIRAKQMKKLAKLQRDRIRLPSTPEVVSKRPQRGGDLAAPLRELSKLTGKPMELPKDSPTPPVQPDASIAGAATPADARNARWQQLTARLSSRDGKPYQPIRTYKAGDVVLHKAHGLGVVESIVNENACMVLFRDTETVLQMGVSPLSLER
jgi:hypothetical protein